eukprot:SAG11_NODE_56_length_19295_cov_20.219675_15_plen_438_part_00
MVDTHRALIDDDVARTEYFYTHVTSVRIERRLFEEDCERRGNSQRARTAAEREQRRVQLATTPRVERPSPEMLNGVLKPRVQNFHRAIVGKLEQLLEDVVKDGAVAPVVALADAPNTSFLAEDVFQYSRKLHDSYGWTSNGFIDCMRRISKAPTEWKFLSLPGWWPNWLTSELIRVRAHNIVKHVWLTRQQIAAVRNAADQAREAVRNSKRDARAAQRCEGDAALLLVLGGLVGEGDNRRPLAAGEPLDMLTARTIRDWASFGTSRSTGWTVAQIENQFRLRNIPDVQEGRRAEMEKLRAAGLLVTVGGREELRVTAPSRPLLVDRLKLVLHTEDKIRITAERAATHAMRTELARQRLEQRRAEEALEAERQADPTALGTRARVPNHRVGEMLAVSVAAQNSAPQLQSRPTVRSEPPSQPAARCTSRRVRQRTSELD